jgi:16S rRNA (guanine1516-N2)-methyltransferase
VLFTIKLGLKMNRLKTVIYVEDKARQLDGELLARRLQLPLVEKPEGYQMVLALTTSRLELRYLANSTIKPLFVDFLAPQTTHRLEENRGRSELIARAVGLKGNYLPTIMDATAGFGQDAIVLVHLGCHVTMIERSPVVCALLEDAITRAQASNLSWSQGLTLYCLDAKDFIKKKIDEKQFFDVVYIDPMFPARRKSALVKKEMRILKLLVGGDEDSEELFNLATQIAQKRVVVKRPIHAHALTHKKPSIVYRGKTCRFDVYLSLLKTRDPL